jgi:hypothetical protein
LCPGVLAAVACAFECGFLALIGLHHGALLQ